MLARCTRVLLVTPITETHGRRGPQGQMVARVYVTQRRQRLHQSTPPDWRVGLHYTSTRSNSRCTSKRTTFAYCYQGKFSCPYSIFFINNIEFSLQAVCCESLKNVQHILLIESPYTHEISSVEM